MKPGRSGNGPTSQRRRLGERPPEPGAQRLEFGLVDFIKRGGIIRVHIQHRKKPALRSNDRDDDFRLRRRRTCDVSREGVDIRHELRLTRPRGRTAHTAIERDTQASMAALIRSDDQQIIRHCAVKPGPVKEIVRGVELALGGFGDGGPEGALRRGVEGAGAPGEGAGKAGEGRQKGRGRASACHEEAEGTWPGGAGQRRGGAGEAGEKPAGNAPR